VKAKMTDMASTLCFHFKYLLYRTRDMECLFEIFIQNCRVLNLH